MVPPLGQTLCWQLGIAGAAAGALSQTLRVPAGIPSAAPSVSRARAGAAVPALGSCVGIAGRATVREPGTRVLPAWHPALGPARGRSQLSAPSTELAPLSNLKIVGRLPLKKKKYINKKVSVKTCLAKRVSLAQGPGLGSSRCAAVRTPCQAGREQSGAGTAELQDQRSGLCRSPHRDRAQGTWQPSGLCNSGQGCSRAQRPPSSKGGGSANPFQRTRTPGAPAILPTCCLSCLHHPMWSHTRWSCDKGAPGTTITHRDHC